MKKLFYFTHPFLRKGCYFSHPSFSEKVCYSSHPKKLYFRKKCVPTRTTIRRRTTLSMPLSVGCAADKKGLRTNPPLDIGSLECPHLFLRGSPDSSLTRKKRHWRITFVGKRSLEWPCERGNSLPPSPFVRYGRRRMNYLSLAFPISSAEWVRFLYCVS